MQFTTIILAVGAVFQFTTALPQPALSNLPGARIPLPCCHDLSHPATNDTPCRSCLPHPRHPHTAKNSPTTKPSHTTKTSHTTKETHTSLAWFNNFTVPVPTHTHNATTTHHGDEQTPYLIYPTVTGSPTKLVIPDPEESTTATVVLTKKMKTKAAPTTTKRTHRTIHYDHA